MTKAIQTTKVVTGEVRLSYLNAFVPKAMEEGQTPKYSAALLIKKTDTVTVEAIKAAIEVAKKEGVAKFGAKFKAIMDSGNLKTPLRDGDAERSDQPEYEGCYFVNANSSNKPGVVDQSVQPILDQTEIYSGCYGRASVNFYAYDRNGNRGIACGLNNIQKLRDGEAFGGATRAEDDFDAVGSPEDDDLLS